MINRESEEYIVNVSNLSYLIEITRGKKHLIREIIDAFLKQVSEELVYINDAITKTDYGTIKRYAHSMKSSVSIMGISMLTPILQEMETLGATADNIEKIKELYQKLNLICEQAIEEIEREKLNYF